MEGGRKINEAGKNGGKRGQERGRERGRGRGGRGLGGGELGNNNRLSVRTSLRWLHNFFLYLLNL